jgi:hypothetical protein
VEQTRDPVASAIGPVVAWAQVRAAEFITRYVRRGSGSPIVILGSAETGGPLWPELADGLVAHHRVILPEAPSVGPRFCVWMRGFLDGIGISSVTLVAGGKFCLPALEFTLADGERVSRLVLTGSAEETPINGGLSTEFRDEPCPLLMLRRSASAAEAIQRVLSLTSQHRTP